MSRAKPTEAEFVAQVVISVVFVIAGFPLLLVGHESTAKMAAV